MKCENCGKNEVTFVYRSNVNGHVEEKHLCAECAERLGYTQRAAAYSRRMMQGFGDLFGGGLLGSFFSDAPGLMGRMLEDPFDDVFAAMPALGAPVREAAEEKSDFVSPEEQSEFSRRRELNALRLEQEKAVREENFERAAQLRDQIRSLEAKGSGSKEQKDSGEGGRTA